MGHHIANMGHLGGIWEPKWGILGVSWSQNGASWGVLEPKWGILGASWSQNRASWGLLGSSWKALDNLWSFLDDFGAIWCQLGPIMGPKTPPKWSQVGSKSDPTSSIDLRDFFCRICRRFLLNCCRFFVIFWSPNLAFSTNVSREMPIFEFHAFCWRCLKNVEFWSIFCRFLVHLGSHVDAKMESKSTKKGYQN